MRFPDSFIAQVQQATDIVDLVSRYVALKQKGKDFVGLCPFHDDHSPSMSVVPAKQLFKCFACGAGGGVFQFLMLFKKGTFPEAVRELAEEAHIPLPQEANAAPVDKAMTGEALVKLMTFAAKFFTDQLATAGGAGALAYAHKRQFTDASIGRFGLGYAPDSWDALRIAAARAGFTERQLIATGLEIPREGSGCYDRFRNRLMFPIHDVNGKIIAFGGRALAADEHAKYLNSPETTLFDKSNNLFALNWSRDAIIKSGQAVVVEGYLDALMPMQAGVENMVATLGTALTERHVRMLARYVKEVVLVYDGDVAGQNATERALELFLAQRVNVRVATVPPAAPDGTPVKDPCDFVLAAGAEAFRQLLADAPDALQHAWSRRRDAYTAANSLAGRRAVLEEFLTLLVRSAAWGAIGSLRQGMLAGQVAELAGVPASDIMLEMRRLSRQTNRPVGAPQSERMAARVESEPSAGAERSERWVLGALMNEPELFEVAASITNPDQFTEPMLRALAQEIWRLGQQGRIDPTLILSASESPEWGRLVTDLQWSAQQRGINRQTIEHAAGDILRRFQDEQVQQRKTGELSTEERLRLATDRPRLDVRRRPKIL